MTSRAGFTLMESVVAMALLALFLTAVAGIIPVYSEIFIKINSSNRCQSIASILFDTIKKELVLAEDAKLARVSQVGEDIVLEDDELEYRARGYAMRMFLDSGHLKIEYKPIEGEVGQSLPSDIAYGDKFYMDTVIEQLLFESVAGYPRLVSVTMTIDYDGYEYTSTRYFEIAGQLEALT